MAPLTFTSVISEQISSEMVAETDRSMENVARLIFPINGIGDVKIEGTNYRIKKGRILHVGPNFPIQFMAVNGAKLEYVVIYFHLSDGEQPKLPLFNSHFPLQVVEHMKLMNIVQQLIETNQKGSHLSFLQSKVLFLNILEEIILLMKVKDYQNIASILTYIQENFTKNITVNDIANECNWDRRKLCYVFEKRMGVSPLVYLTDLRIQKSKMLLRSSDFSIKEIADRVGYTDYFYFSRVFKKVTGLSPSIFRKQMN
ncbi:helix-turn-helix domain-containing protein [Lysinibacillus fusiformis]|uniref:helix-turn-helix domain-containing protein n=1 Tax=Lysinibacillus fusiformis TaxID=28031 RepID=UPI00215A1FBC|nr:AraC family transcriptional regulator [Lysinibacillus fusiformis]MCR8854458.1 AraC family transcriptional regulator [Lysinibacillus fusiformis]WKT76536.1 AraC family transcriptional regulator [Lysinibacillus fusiformis]